MSKKNKASADLPSSLKNQVHEQGKSYSIYLLLRCLQYFKPYKLQIAIAVFGMLFAALGQALTAWLIEPAMNLIFKAHNPNALYYVPIAVVVVTAAKCGGRITQNYMMQYCGLKVLEDLRSDLYTKIIKMPMLFFENTQVGMLISRIINDVLTIRTSLPAIIILIRQGLTIIALLGVAFYQDVKLTLISLVVLPLAVYPFIHFGRKLRKLGRSNQQIWAAATIVLQEILSGIKVVKAFSTEEKEGKTFDKENERMVSVGLKQTMASSTSSAIMETVGAIAASVIIVYGGYQVIYYNADPGSFLSLIASLAMMYDPLKKLSDANNDIQHALASAERVFEILDSDEITEEQSGEVELTPPLQEIEFKDVVFGYSEQNTALKQINLTVKQGERLAIVGPSGAGKSTFISLIPRFYDPQSGSITINGVDIKDYTLHSLRKNISIVSQDNFLFNTTIRENIAYGQEGAFTEDEVISAAKSAYAHDFITELPEGYDTIVGERGVKLSGGQKQRITIARAIAKNSPFLILDEATSALDSESEKIVQKALENLMQGRTNIVIAHRLSTILESDRILVMDKGEIVGQGTHAELLENSALYAKLYAMQFGESEEK